ncbi:MAG: type II toxin-antitoxin system HicA family toxin, partial [Clostridia bacterium]|nr:type II toxin-antitoxin system HicA family toxin [Clostridia bacterium]
MKRCSSREILRILWEHGWVVKNQVGSHVQLVHPARPGKVTVPHPRKELPSKTVRSI